MTCDFASFPAIFQLYQDNVKMIMKGCMHHRDPCLRLGRVPVSAGFEPRAASYSVYPLSYRDFSYNSE